MNPISFNLSHNVLYTVGAIGGWLSVNPVLCLGIVYGFMGTQSLHLVHVLAVRAFYVHGNLLGGVCVSSMLLGQAVLVTIEFLGWAQPLAIRWRYNAAFVTAISLSMCLVAWVIPRRPLVLSPTNRAAIRIFTPLADSQIEVKSVRDPRVWLYSVLCSSLYVLIPRGGANFANDLTSILGFSHGTKPAFLWGTLLGYGIGNLLFYASLCLSRSVTSLVTKRTFYELSGTLSRVLGGMVLAAMIIQFRVDPFELENSLSDLKYARKQVLLVAQDRASDWIPSVAKQRLALYGRVYQIEEEMGAFNQLLLRSLVDEKNSLQSLNLLPDLCEQPTFGGLTAQVRRPPTAGLSTNVSSEPYSDREIELAGDIELTREGNLILEDEKIGQDIFIQPFYEKITPQEYLEKSRGFAFPWEKKDLVRHLGRLSLPKGRVLGLWHTYGSVSEAEKPWRTAFLAYQQEQWTSSNPRKKSNTEWEQPIVAFTKRRKLPWLGGGGRKRQKALKIEKEFTNDIFPKAPEDLRLLPWDNASKRKPIWTGTARPLLKSDAVRNAAEHLKRRAKHFVMTRKKEKPQRKLKKQNWKKWLKGFLIKVQRTRAQEELDAISTAVLEPNGMLLTHVPLQANSEQVQELFEGHAFERLRRVFQLWERRSMSNALFLFKERTKSWFHSEDVYQDVVNRLFSPSEALFDYCVRLIAYAQHQRAFACVIRPQTHLAWTELDRAPRLCFAMAPGLSRTRPAYQVQERIADIYAYLYGEEEEAKHMMEELRLPSFPKEQDKGAFATRRLGKAQILAILESRMLRQRAGQGRRVPLRLESEGRLIPPPSIAHSVHSWGKRLRTRTTGLLAKQLLRRNGSGATFRPTRPVDLYARGQQWTSRSDERLSTGSPGQFPFLLIPRLLEALSNESLEPSNRRLPFPQLRSLVQAPGLKSSRLGPGPVCHRPGLLSRSLDPITANIVATTPTPQGPGDRARRQALRKQALLLKHQGRKLEWATRKMARTLDRHEELSVWSGPIKAGSVPLIDRFKHLQQNLWKHIVPFKTGREQPIEQSETIVTNLGSQRMKKRSKGTLTRANWLTEILLHGPLSYWLQLALNLLHQPPILLFNSNKKIWPSVQLLSQGYGIGIAENAPSRAHTNTRREIDLNYQERVGFHLNPTSSKGIQALKNQFHGKAEKEIREALFPWWPQKQGEREDRQKVFDLQVSLHSLHQMSHSTRLSSSVPWILWRASVYAKEKARVKAILRTLYAKSSTWVGPTPSLSPLSIPFSSLWQHRRAKIQLYLMYPRRSIQLREATITPSWSGFVNDVHKKRTAPRWASDRLGLAGIMDWVGPLEDRWSNLWQQRTWNAVRRGHRMLLALHCYEWDKRSLLYNPLPPFLGKKLRTERQELARLANRKLNSEDRTNYLVPQKWENILAKRNRESNLYLMLSHSLRLTSLRLYEQDGRKALASLSGLGPLSFFADDERALARVRLDDSRVDPSLRRRAWEARYRLAIKRILDRGNNQKQPIEVLRTMRRQTHKYRVWDSLAQKHIPQSELANMGLSDSHRLGQPLELLSPALGFGDELEKLEMTLGLFDTGIQPYEKGVPMAFKRNEKGKKAKRSARSRDKQREGTVPENVAYTLPLDMNENVNYPSFLFKPEGPFVTLDDIYESFPSLYWYDEGWEDDLDDLEEVSEEHKQKYVGEDKWRNTEEDMDERDQTSSLPFRKIYLRYLSHVEPRNPSRARIVAEEWFAQSFLPAGERKAYLDEQKERIEEIENRKQTVIPSLKDKSLRREWHRHMGRPINRVNEADRWRGVISKRKHHYPIGPVARFHLEHSGLPEERVLGRVPMDPHIEDAEFNEGNFGMPEHKVMAEMEKQNLPRLSRWALGELRSRIETDDTQEGIRKDVMRRAWERGDDASWAARSGSPPDLEAILEYEKERADEQSGTERLHTSALDQVAIRDLYLMKRIMRRLRLAFRLASLHLQSRWLKSSNPQRMRRPTQLEKAWAWTDFFRFHATKNILLHRIDKLTIKQNEEDEWEERLMETKVDSTKTNHDSKSKVEEVASMRDLLNAVESLTFSDTNAREMTLLGFDLKTLEKTDFSGNVPLSGLRPLPLKEPDFFSLIAQSSSESFVQSMDKALNDPFPVKLLLPSQRERLKKLRDRQAHLGGRCKPYQATSQKGLLRKVFKDPQPAQGLKLAKIQSWQPETPVRRLGLSDYLVGVRRHIEWNQGRQPFLPYNRAPLGLVGSNSDRPNTRTKIEEESFWTAEMSMLLKIKDFFPTYEHRSPWRQLWDDMFGRESMEAQPMRRRLRPGLDAHHSYKLGQGLLGIPRLVKSESSHARAVGPASLHQYKYYPTVIEPLYPNTRYSKRNRKGKRRPNRIANFFESDFDDVNPKMFIPRNNDNEQLVFILNTAYETFQNHPDWDLLERGISFGMDLKSIRQATRARTYDLRGQDQLLILADRYSKMLGGVWIGKFVEIFSWLFRVYLGLFTGMFRTFTPLLPTSDSSASMTFMILGKPQLIYQPSNKGFFPWDEYEQKVSKGKWKRIPSFIGLRDRSSHFTDHMIAVRIKNPFEAIQLALQAFLHNPWKALNEIDVQSFVLTRNDYDHLNYYLKLYARVYPPDNSAEGLRKYYSRFIRIRESVTKQLWKFFGFTRVPYHEIPYINKRFPHYYLKTYGQVPGVEPWWLGMDLQGYDWVVKAGSSKAQSRYEHPIQVRTSLNWLRLQRYNPREFERMRTLANKVGKRRARGLPHYTSIKDFAFWAHLSDSDKLTKTLVKKVQILDGQKTQQTSKVYVKEQFQPEPQPQEPQLPKTQPQEPQPEPQPEPQNQEPQPEPQTQENLNSYKQFSNPEGLEYQKQDRNLLFTSVLIQRSLDLWKRLAPDPSRQRLLRKMTRIRRRALGHKLHLWVARLWQHSSYSLQVPLPLLSKLGQDIPLSNQSYTEHILSRLLDLKQREREGRQLALGQERAAREALVGVIRHEWGRKWNNKAHHETQHSRSEKSKMMERFRTLKDKAYNLYLPIQGRWNSFVHVAHFFVIHWRHEGWRMLSPWRQAKLWDEARPLWRQPSYSLSRAQIAWASNKVLTYQQRSLNTDRGTLPWAEETLPPGSVIHGLVRQIQDMSYLTSLRDMESTVAMAVLEGSRILHQDSPESQAFDTKLYSLERKKVERSISLASNLAQIVEDQCCRQGVTKVEKNCLESSKRCLERAIACLAQSAVLNPHEVWEKESISLEDWAMKWQAFAFQRGAFNLKEPAKDQPLQFSKSLSQREKGALTLKQKRTVRDKMLLWQTAEIERLVRGTCNAALHQHELQHQRLVVLFQGLALDIHSTGQTLKNIKGLREPMSLTEGKRIWSRRDPSLRERALRSMPVRLREAALVCLKAAPKSALSLSMEDKINRRLRLYARHRKGMLQAYRESQKALETILLEVPQVIERAVMGLRQSRPDLEEALDLLRRFMGMNEEACHAKINGAWVREGMARLMVTLYDLSLPSHQLADILQQEATKSMSVRTPSTMLHAPRENRRLHTPWGLAVRSLPKVEIPLEVEWQLRTLSNEAKDLSYHKQLQDRLLLEKGAKLGLLHSEDSARLEQLRQQMSLNNVAKVTNEVQEDQRMVNLADTLTYVKKVSISYTSPAQDDLAKTRPGIDGPEKLGADYDYYGVESWDTNRDDKILQGNMVLYDLYGNYSEDMWTWGQSRCNEDMLWDKNEESLHIEFLHWQAVQDIRAWRALMGSSTKADSKPVLLDIHTPLDPVLFMGPVQPQVLPPSLHCPLAREMYEPESQRGKRRTPRLDNPELDYQGHARDGQQPPLPRMKVRTVGWAMGVVQRKFVYSPPFAKHAREEHDIRQQDSKNLSIEAHQGIDRWQCQASDRLDQPIRPEKIPSGNTWQNRLVSQALLPSYKAFEQFSQWIDQLTAWANRASHGLKNQIKTWSHLPGELSQLNASRAEDRPQHRTHPPQSWAHAQPIQTFTHNTEETLQDNDERKRLPWRLPAKELPVFGQESVTYGAEKNKQDRLFASKVLLNHMGYYRKSQDPLNHRLKRVMTSDLKRLGQEEPLTQRMYEQKVRHVGNRLPEPIPLQPFFSQWMDLQVSQLKGYENDLSVARTMAISTKDLYMTTMGTLARPMAHQMSYSFHGLPERFIQKTMYSSRTWRASSTWLRTRYSFGQNPYPHPYQQTWRERLKPLRRYLREQGVDWMVNRFDPIWREKIMDLKTDSSKVFTIELAKSLAQFIYSEFIRRSEQFKQWARNKVYKLFPKSFWHLVFRSHNKPNRKNERRSHGIFFQRFKHYVHSAKSWVMAYLQRFFNLFSTRRQGSGG